MINCLRSSNKSSRLTLPLGPSNSYFFSTAIQGIRRRSAARASRERVRAFSFTRSCCRAVSHSCCDTIGGGFIARCPFACSLFVDIFISPYYLDLERFLLLCYFSGKLSQPMLLDRRQKPPRRRLFPWLQNRMDTSSTSSVVNSTVELPL